MVRSGIELSRSKSDERGKPIDTAVGDILRRCIRRDYRALNSTGTEQLEPVASHEEIYKLCCAGRRINLVVVRPGWAVWGNQAEASYRPTWNTYAYNSAVPAE
jgi:hypothetical protein